MAHLKLKPLDEQVIVITGASSGIGLATAEAAAKEGAKLVLASRSAHTLEEVVQRINSEGGGAIHVVADVADRPQVQQGAEAAIRRFGRIDTWINDAGLSIYGRLDEVRDEDSRRLRECVARSRPASARCAPSAPLGRPDRRPRTRLQDRCRSKRR